MATVSNKRASVLSPARVYLRRRATDQGASFRSARPACAAASGWCSDVVGETAVLTMSRVLLSQPCPCCAGALSGAGGRLVTPVYRRPPAAAVLCSSGVGDGDPWAQVLPELRLWMVVGGFVSLLRFHRTGTADQQSSEHGEVPRPTSHKDSVSLLCDGPFNRLTKLFQRWCFGGYGVLGSSSSPPAVLRRGRWSATSGVDDVCFGLQGLICNFVFSGVVCAMFRGHLRFWVLLVSAACLCSICLEL